ncbi:hypothetical protein HXX76_014026 [Chlamydomonas incerta]|uniref:Ubiquitin-like protease family profile domain-containing protein n=1 Tax=Chlamydomonas incerta TaxID=51695 RepID=A0A835SS20_CHLIN|nr:hypothetical protein HXX76_014026 [Chlamydomonas incerta]|eukprot:KAG2424866.1 hypothetical protein HXX76_014026 [Chlamydomonas incerta]
MAYGRQEDFEIDREEDDYAESPSGDEQYCPTASELCAEEEEEEEEEDGLEDEGPDAAVPHAVRDSHEDLADVDEGPQIAEDGNREELQASAGAGEDGGEEGRVTFLVELMTASDAKKAELLAELTTYTPHEVQILKQAFDLLERVRGRPRSRTNQPTPAAAGAVRHGDGAAAGAPPSSGDDGASGNGVAAAVAAAPAAPAPVARAPGATKYPPRSEHAKLQRSAKGGADTCYNLMDKLHGKHEAVGGEQLATMAMAVDAVKGVSVYGLHAAPLRLGFELSAVTIAAALAVFQQAGRPDATVIQAVEHYMKISLTNNAGRLEGEELSEEQLLPRLQAEFKTWNKETARWGATALNTLLGRVRKSLSHMMKLGAAAAGAAAVGAAAAGAAAANAAAAGAAAAGAAAAGAVAAGAAAAGAAAAGAVAAGAAAAGVVAAGAAARAGAAAAGAGVAAAGTGAREVTGRQHTPATVDTRPAAEEAQADVAGTAGTAATGTAGEVTGTADAAGTGAREVTGRQHTPATVDTRPAAEEAQADVAGTAGTAATGTAGEVTGTADAAGTGAREVTGRQHTPATVDTRPAAEEAQADVAGTAGTAATGTAGEVTGTADAAGTGAREVTGRQQAGRPDATVIQAVEHYMKISLTNNAGRLEGEELSEEQLLPRLQAEFKTWNKETARWGATALNTLLGRVRKSLSHMMKLGAAAAGAAAVGAAAAGAAAANAAAAGAAAAGAAAAGAVAAGAAAAGAAAAGAVAAGAAAAGVVAAGAAARAGAAAAGAGVAAAGTGAREVTGRQHTPATVDTRPAAEEAQADVAGTAGTAATGTAGEVTGTADAAGTGAREVTGRQHTPATVDTRPAAEEAQADVAGTAGTAATGTAGEVTGTADAAGTGAREVTGRQHTPATVDTRPAAEEAQADVAGTAGTAATGTAGEVTGTADAAGTGAREVTGRQHTPATVDTRPAAEEAQADVAGTAGTAATGTAGEVTGTADAAGTGAREVTGRQHTPATVDTRPAAEEAQADVAGTAGTAATGTAGEVTGTQDTGLMAGVFRAAERYANGPSIEDTAAMVRERLEEPTFQLELKRLESLMRRKSNSVLADSWRDDVLPCLMKIYCRRPFLKRLLWDFLHFLGEVGSNVPHGSRDKRYHILRMRDLVVVPGHARGSALEALCRADGGTLKDWNRLKAASSKRKQREDEDSDGPEDGAADADAAGGSRMPPRPSAGADEGEEEAPTRATKRGRRDARATAAAAAQGDDGGAVPARQRGGSRRQPARGRNPQGAGGASDDGGNAEALGEGDGGDLPLPSASQRGRGRTRGAARGGRARGGSRRQPARGRKPQGAGSASDDGGNAGALGERGRGRTRGAARGGRGRGGAAEPGNANEAYNAAFGPPGPVSSGGGGLPGGAVSGGSGAPLRPSNSGAAGALTGLVRVSGQPGPVNGSGGGQPGAVNGGSGATPGSADGGAAGGGGQPGAVNGGSGATPGSADGGAAGGGGQPGAVNGGSGATPGSADGGAAGGGGQPGAVNGGIGATPGSADGGAAGGGGQPGAVNGGSGATPGSAADGGAAGALTGLVHVSGQPGPVDGSGGGQPGAVNGGSGATPGSGDGGAGSAPPGPGDGDGGSTPREDSDADDADDDGDGVRGADQALVQAEGLEPRRSAPALPKAARGSNGGGGSHTASDAAAAAGATAAAVVVCAPVPVIESTAELISPTAVLIPRAWKSKRPRGEVDASIFLGLKRQKWAAATGTAPKTLQRFGELAFTSAYAGDGLPRGSGPNCSLTRFLRAREAERLRQQQPPQQSPQPRSQQAPQQPRSTKSTATASASLLAPSPHQYGLRSKRLLGEQRDTLAPIPEAGEVNQPALGRAERSVPKAPVDGQPDSGGSGGSSDASKRGPMDGNEAWAFNMQLAAMADKLTDPEDREPGKGRKRRKREPTLQEKLYGQWDGTYGDHLERELGGGSAVKEPPLQDYEPPVFAPEVSDSDIEDSGGGPREAEPGKGGGGVGGAPPAPGAASCAPPGLDHDSGQPGADNGGSSGGLAEPGKGGGGGSGGAPPAPGAAGCAPPGPGLDHDSGQPGADNGGNSGGLADLARAAAAAAAEARRQPLVPAMPAAVNGGGGGGGLAEPGKGGGGSNSAPPAPDPGDGAPPGPGLDHDSGQPGADNGGSSGGLAEPGKGGGGSNSAPPAPDPGDGAPPGLDHDSGQAGADDGSNGGLAEPGKGGGGGGGAPPAPGAAGCVPPGLDHDSGQAGADDGSNGGLAERGKGGGGGGAPPAPGAAGCVPPGLDHDSGQAGADDGSNGGLAERGKGGGGGGGAPPAPGAAGCVPPGLDHDSGQAGADDGSNGGLAERGKGGGGGGAPPAPGAAGCAPPGLDHDSGQPGADNGGSSGGLAEPGTGGGGGGGAPPAPGAAGCVPPGLDHDSGQAGADDGSNGGLAERGKGGGGGGAPPAPGAAGCAPPGLDHDSGQPGADNGGSSGGLAEPGTGGGGGGGAPPAPGAGDGGGRGGGGGGAPPAPVAGGAGGGAPRGLRLPQYVGLNTVVPPLVDNDVVNAAAGGMSEAVLVSARPSEARTFWQMLFKPGSDKEEVLVVYNPREEIDIKLVRRNLQRLGKAELVDDDVMSQLARLLQARDTSLRTDPAAAATALACHFFDIWFYKKLFQEGAKYGYTKVRRWTTPTKLRIAGQHTPDESILMLDRIFFLVHHDTHYVCAEVDVRAQELRLYDPFTRVEPEPRETRIDRAEETAAVKFGIQVLDNLATWVEDEAKVTLRADLAAPAGQRWRATRWQRTIVAAPRQADGSNNCAIFAVMYMLRRSTGRPLDFSEADMDRLRVEFAYMLWRGLVA